MTTMEPVPVQLVAPCPTKWDYKAVERYTALLVRVQANINPVPSKNKNCDNEQTKQFD